MTLNEAIEKLTEYKDILNDTISEAENTDKITIPQGNAIKTLADQLDKCDFYDNEIELLIAN